MKKKTYKLADKLKYTFAKVPVKPGKVTVNLFRRNFYTIHSRKGTDPTWGPYIK